MKMVLKYAAAVTLAGALAVAASSPSQARYGRNAAIIGGVAAGAVVGAAVAAGSAGYYGPGYAYGAPEYAYAPGYAYAPAPGYAPGYAPQGYGYRTDSCTFDAGYGKADHSFC